MKKSILILAALLTVETAIAQSAAQEKATAYEQFTRALGFSGGSLSGVGLSYRQWFGPAGYQLVAGGYYEPSGWMDYWIGAEYFQRLFAAEFADWFFNQLYLFAGAGHHGFIHEEPYQPEFALGGGFGIEVGWFQHLSTTFEWGYSAFWPFSVQLVIQGSFHYRF